MLLDVYARFNGVVRGDILLDVCILFEDWILAGPFVENLDGVFVGGYGSECLYGVLSRVVFEGDGGAYFPCVVMHEAA